MEMGLLVGTRVELVRFAPMGDPVEIKVRGYNLTLRKNEAEQILVNRPNPTDAAFNMAIAQARDNFSQTAAQSSPVTASILHSENESAAATEQRKPAKSSAHPTWC